MTGIFELGTLVFWKCAIFSVLDDLCAESSRLESCLLFRSDQLLDNAYARLTLNYYKGKQVEKARRNIVIHR